MAELKRMRCNCCGHDFDEASVKNGVITCAYCGSVFTVARSTDERVLNFLDSGELALGTCRFDEALTAYTKAAELDSSEPEAYFGIALAKFKVKYLKDEVNNRLQPICHEVTDKKFSDDPDYMRAYMKATAEQRTAYEIKAKEIDYIQGEFLKIQKSGLNYDCFICVKVTGDDGKTEDSKDAEYIYHLLKEKGYKPFYSEYEIRNKQGANYEAHILYALYSSECMLVVCRDENYLQTKWVKNEYTRFLKLVNDEEKESDSITIVFNGKPIEKLPGKNGKIQGIDFSLRSADGQIVNFVENHTPEAKKRRKEAAEAKKREAEEQKRELAEQRKAIEEQQRAFEEQQKKIAEELEKLKNSPSASQSSGGISDDDLLEKMERARAERERKKQEEERERQIENSYNEACEQLKSDDLKTVLLAEKTFESISGFKDADEKLAECKERIAELKRIAEEKAKERAQFIAKLKKKIISIVSIAIAIVISVSVTTFIAINHSDKVARAGLKLDLSRDGSYYIVDDIDESEISENYIIPSKYKGKPVTQIDNEAFRGYKDIKSITIPDSITSIGNFAFTGCEGLEKITIAASVTSIGSSAFSECNNLKGVYITDLTAWCNIDFNLSYANPLQAAHNLYLNNNLVTNLEIPQDVTEIKSHAFEGCTSITSATIPASVTSIGENAFSGCTSLKNVYFSDTNGWEVSYHIISSDISDSTTAANYLAYKYAAFTWTKS